MTPVLPFHQQPARHHQLYARGLCADSCHDDVYEATGLSVRNLTKANPSTAIKATQHPCP